MIQRNFVLEFDSMPKWIEVINSFYYSYLLSFISLNNNKTIYVKVCWIGKNPQKVPQHHSRRKLQPTYGCLKYKFGERVNYICLSKLNQGLLKASR